MDNNFIAKVRGHRKEKMLPGLDVNPLTAICAKWHSMY